MISLAGPALAKDSGEKVYVIERARGEISVIQNGVKIGKIKKLGKLHHGTVKFSGNFGYVISRDGLLSKIDTAQDKVIGQVRVGKSSIGLTFWKKWILVSNYDPGTVVVISEDLSIHKTISTGSRNVGIKVWNDYIIFSLMDKDEIWILKADENFKVFRTYRNVGKMPFDGLLTQSIYIAGFFKDPSLAVIDLKTLKCKKIFLKNHAGEVIFKIPHFGLWGVEKGRVFIPATKEKKLYILSLKTLKLTGSIPLSGFPVFGVVSPTKKILAINYSGDQEDFFTLLQLSSLKIRQHFRGGKRILHFRFSQKGDKIYLSSYYENLVKIYFISQKKWGSKIAVPTPSGIFLVPPKGGK